MHPREVEVGAPEGNSRGIASNTPMAAATAGPSIVVGSLLTLDCRLLNVYWGSSSVSGTSGSLWMAGSRPPLPPPSPPAHIKTKIKNLDSMVWWSGGLGNISQDRQYMATAGKQ